MHPPHDAEHAHAGHEQSDAKNRPLILFGVALTVLAIAAFAGMRALFVSFSERQAALDVPRHPLAAQIEVPPEPRLESMPGYDLGPLGANGERPFATRGLAVYRAEEQAILESYGWIDRPTGVVRVPIERAIELTLKEGLPIAGDAKGH